MAEPKKKKLKKVSKRPKDPYAVFDLGRRASKDGKKTEMDRKEIIRQDKLKLAKRYEAIKMFDESIKYYKQIGMDEEAERVLKKKTDLYSEKAVEFEREGRYAEAAELFERIHEPERAGEMRRKGGIKDLQPFSLDMRYGEDDPEEALSVDPKLETTRNVRWEMPNVDMESMGKNARSQSKGPAAAARTISEEPGDDNEPIPLQTSQDLVRSAEADEKNTADSKPGSNVGGNKKFRICPYCGEELNLPKQPKFCPYCREALS